MTCVVWIIAIAETIIAFIVQLQLRQQPQQQPLQQKFLVPIICLQIRHSTSNGKNLISASQEDMGIILSCSKRD